MAKIVDIDIAQEALNRAARNSKHGASDVRAGRFVSPEARSRRSAPRKDRTRRVTSTFEKQLAEGKRIAQRLRNEARWAQHAWAFWEALNGESDDERKEFRQALEHLMLGGQASFLQQLLVRDTLLTLFRISDQRNNDRLTLCAISDLLQDDNFCTRLAARDRLIAEGCAEWLADLEAGKQPKRIAIICSFVPPRWSDQAPKERALHDLRHRLKDVRDKILAHSLDGVGVTQPIANEMREFLKITTTLVRKAELIFLGSAHTTEDQFQAHLNGANRFLDLLEEGPIGAYKQDMALRKRAGIE